MKKILKKWQLIFLSCVLAFAPAYALANTVLNGWTITDRAMEGATRVYNGAKTAVINGANVAKTSVARIKPTTDIVSKAIVRTGAVVAVDLAIQALIGAVDYVMDAENNRVIYYPDGRYLWVNVDSDVRYNSAEEACKSYTQAHSKYYISVQVNEHGTAADCVFSSSEDSPYVSTTILTAVEPTLDEREKSIPYTTVADQIISDAETDARAGGYVGEAIDAEVAKGGAMAQDVANQFDANAQTQTAEGANEATGTAEPNTANPEATDISLEFPAFCGWAPQVCEAANVVINFPTLLVNWWETATNAFTSAWATVTEYFDWMKEEDLPNRDTSDITLPDTPITPQTVNVNFGKTCPAPTTVNISFGGQSKEITIMNYEFICEWGSVQKTVSFP